MTEPDRSQADLEARVSQLEARLRAVEDIGAIARMKARYGALVDQRYHRGDVVEREELDRIAGEITRLFTRDAVWDGGKGLGLCTGHDEIRARFAEPTMKFTWHYFVKPQIEVDGDTARATWDIFAPCTLQDGRPFWMAGVEHDEYRREEDAWLHSRMKLDLVFLAPFDKGWARIPRPDA